jgi:hypothetical protein
MTVLSAEEKENSQDGVVTLAVARFPQDLNKGRNVASCPGDRQESLGGSHTSNPRGCQVSTFQF